MYVYVTLSNPALWLQDLNKGLLFVFRKTVVVYMNLTMSFPLTFRVIWKDSLQLRFSTCHVEISLLLASQVGICLSVSNQVTHTRFVAWAWVVQTSNMSDWYNWIEGTVKLFLFSLKVFCLYLQQASTN